MAESKTFEKINKTKANLNHIYNQPDPRAYFRELRKLGYQIPGSAKPLFESVIAHLRHERQEPIQLLDLGCSYGVNAALLKHDLSMADLYDHWGNASLADAEPDEIRELDRHYFNGHGESELEVIGFDVAEHAVAFAAETGLLDSGFAANLEVEPLPSAAQEELDSVDLVTSTGCVGYVTEKSFEQLMPAMAKGQSPWMANFVLRLFPFEPIEATLADWGYVTEKLEGETFIQRRFASAEEQEGVLRQLRQHDIDPAGKEAEGHLHAEFYLSRPAEEAGRVPLRDLIAN
jgi:hypothetical protein